MAYQTPITVKKVLERIHHHAYVLPAIQREFVWEPPQICRLFDSLLRGYPIGTFLFWRVQPELSQELNFYDVMREYHDLKNRHSQQLAIPQPREVTAILDGQQRLTSLNVGLCGSYTSKIPRKWANNPDAYPKKFLHLDLRYEPNGEDTELELQYGFAFMSELEAKAAPKEANHWFPVPEILELPETPGVFAYIQDAGLAEHPRAFYALDALRKAVHEQPIISFYEEEEQSLSKVLDIFVRVNSGGTVLAKSDLLLSIATAQWKDRDARETIHGLVDDLNAIRHFVFTKDLILKAGLVMTDISDPGFKVENFTRTNMDILDRSWDRISKALQLGAKLLANFGFSGINLSANSVLIPVADYLYQRGADDSFLTVGSQREERDKLRAWVIRTLVKPGVWGSGLDTFLKALRKVMRDHNPATFPVEAIETEMAKLGKSVKFDALDVADLADTPYKSKRVFPLLTLLYPGMDVRNEFHEDHIFPKSRFTAAKLRAAGVPDDQVENFQESVGRLPNLQLLEGSVNVAKQAVLPMEWATTHYPNAAARGGYLASHDMHDLPDGIPDFLVFCEARRERMISRLTELLGVGSP
jgi:hypothetical protein